MKLPGMKLFSVLDLRLIINRQSCPDAGLDAGSGVFGS